MVLMYIYAYENKVNGKMYIGQTIDIKERDGGHQRSSHIGFDAALKKYGRDNFDLFVMQMASSFEEADELEIFWIAEMRNFLGRKNVYNIADGGSSNRGMNEEIRNKISNSLKGKTLGKKLSPEHCKHIAEAKMGDKNPNFGKHPSEETRQKFRIRSGGENNSKAKLTVDKVSKIRELLRTTDKTLQEIATEFNISLYTIADIKKVRTWKNVK
jgi:group I intron endonuclease